MAKSSDYSSEHGFLPDGEALKLRASCDACNSSKVRCSQAKPSCSRCERQGISCIYGLSRRSHRTAPRIGEAQTSALPSLASSSGSTSNDTTNEDSGLGNPSDQLDADLLCMTPGTPSKMAADSWSYALGLGDETIFSPPTAPASVHMHDTSPPVGDTSDLRMLTMLDHFSPLACQGMGPASSSIAKSIALDDMVLATNEAGDQNSGQGCTCRDTLHQVQALLPHETFDTQLSRLKQNVGFLQDALSCSCIFHKQTVILSIGVSLGRMIEDFEIISSRIQHLTTTARLPESSNHQHAQSSTARRSTLSDMQIDSDEEHALKRHLWLLQFQKLEKVLDGLDMATRSLKTAEGNTYAHVMACESLQSWLTHRTKSAREKFQHV